MPSMVSAQEASAAVKAAAAERNHMNIVGLPPQVERLMTSKDVKPIRIFNVSHYRWTDRPGGNKYFVIEACEPGQRFSKPTIVPFIPTYNVAVEMNKMEMRTEDCEAVAKDIMGIGAFKPKSDNLTKYGVFATTNEVPTEEELQAAEAAYEASDMNLISDADSLYLEGPNGIKNITADMRKACDRRHVVRDWAKVQKAGQQCPGCGEMVLVGIKKHPLCGWRFDLGCFEGDAKSVMSEGYEDEAEAPKSRSRR